MRCCELDLGPQPWERLAAGRVRGECRFGEGERLPVSVRIRGAHTRRFPKKSLQLDFPASLLPDEPPAGHAVRRLHLNADYIDPTLMRTALSFALFAGMQVPAPLCRHVALTVNGKEQGLYLGLESVDKDFCRRRNWENGPIYYAINRNADFGLKSPISRECKQPPEVGYRSVTRADLAPVRRLVTELNLAGCDGFPGVAERLIDVAEYLRWLMVAVFTGNRDGFLHNYALYLNPTDGRFRIIPWDYDATWGINIHGEPARVDRVPVTGWNHLTRRLFRYARYRRWYRTRFRRALLDGPLSAESVGSMISALGGHLGPWMDRHDSTTATRFWAGVETLCRWSEERRALLLHELELL